MSSLKPNHPVYLANEAQQPNQDLEVTDKFTRKIATRVALADAATTCRTVKTAAPMASYERQAVLAHCVTRLTERAYAPCVEAGKPIGDSRGEVGRLIDTSRKRRKGPCA